MTGGSEPLKALCDMLITPFSLYIANKPVPANARVVKMLESVSYARLPPRKYRIARKDYGSWDTLCRGSFLLLSLLRTCETNLHHRLP